MVQFVDENAKCPNVTFGAVKVMNESFWAHVERASDMHIFEVVLVFDGEPEVCQFELLLLVDEDIGQFEVSVDNRFLG